MKNTTTLRCHQLHPTRLCVWHGQLTSCRTVLVPYIYQNWSYQWRMGGTQYLHLGKVPYCWRNDLLSRAISNCLRIQRGCCIGTSWGKDWRWRERAGGHGNMTWDLLLLCNGFGPVGTIRSESGCAMRFICGSLYLASISRLRNLSASMAAGEALTDLQAFLLQSCSWSQARWISLRNRPLRPTRTFHLFSTSEPPVSCMKHSFLTKRLSSVSNST